VIAFMSLLTLSKLAELKAETEAAQVTTAFLSEYWPIAQAVPCARIKMTALPKHFSYLNNETIFTKKCNKFETTTSKEKCHQK